MKKSENKVGLNFQLMNKIPKFASLYYSRSIIHN